MPGLSVVVTTLNEEINVARALRSARLLSDDLVVIDSGSTDDTVAIAESLGARILRRPFDDMASQRNAVLRSGILHHPFAMFLDADEMVTQAFADGLRRLLEARPELDGVRICRKFHFWGRWVRSASSFPRFIDRVVRVGTVHFRKEGHGEVFEGGTDFVELAEPLHDEDLKGIGAWIERHNRYAAMEAREDLRLLADGASGRPGLRAVRARLRRWPGWPLAALLYYLVLRGGLFEGRAGWTYCRLKAMYEYFVKVHALQLERSAAQAGSSAGAGDETRAPR